MWWDGGMGAGMVDANVFRGTVVGEEMDWLFLVMIIGKEGVLVHGGTLVSGKTLYCTCSHG